MIEISHLSKRYGELTAVDDISFNVQPGEVLGFLGPNGAGKSTTMKMITGFLTPTAGSVRVCGHDVESAPLAAKGCMGYLPEGAPSYGEMSVRNFLEFIADIRGLVGDRYHESRGTFSSPHSNGHELTLVEAETLAELDIPWTRVRRNVVTRGTLLNPLVGRRFRIGGVECVGRRLAEPCAHLERVSGSGLLRPLVHRGGLRADILLGGTIRLGDELVQLD